MEQLSHRDLRNNSGEVLRRVAAGETVTVTNNGRPVAVLAPIGGSALDLLESRGALRRATLPPTSLRGIRRRSPIPTSEIVADTRGDW